MDETNFVEAIQEGKIVKVSESYARREGLPIVRKPSIRHIRETLDSPTFSPSKPKQVENKLTKHDFSKRKLNWRDDQVLNELVENFHWHIATERRRKNLTRKQLAQLINEPEEHIKMLEHGMLPHKDFVIINKLQSILKINLRKDKKTFDKSMHELLSQSAEQDNIKEFKQKPKEESPRSFSGDEIELLED